MNELFPFLNEDNNENDRKAIEEKLTKRTTPNGDVLDYEITEITDLSRTPPHTKKIFHTKKPLDCSHHLDQNHPIGGYCTAKKHPFSKSCQKSFCSECQAFCDKCLASISSQCCVNNLNTKSYKKRILCPWCYKTERFKQILGSTFNFIITPFIKESHE